MSYFAMGWQLDLELRTWSRLLAVVTLFLVALSGYYFEDFKEWFPWLTTFQLRTYNWISGLGVRRPRAKFVAGVEIDDRTFYEVMRLPAGAVTDRAKLGEIIEKVSEFHPAVIILDIDLTREPADSDEPRKSANNTLLLDIQEVVARNVPVVLSYAFDDGKHQIPNIYVDHTLPGFADPNNPYRVHLGFDHVAGDLRKVPLVVDRLSPEGASRPYRSMALEAVDAYEEVVGIQERTTDRLGRRISNREFVYTTFLHREQFLHVSAADLLESNEKALGNLNHRIVIVGGNRHTRFPPPADEWLDDHDIPPLRLRGMYVQANYIEGLLDDRTLFALPEWLAFLIDLTLGGLMIYLSSRGRTISKRLLVLGVFFLPVALAYVASANLGYVIDFVLPLTLLFVHAFADHYLHLRLDNSELNGGRHAS
jgi:CHASE2 domain-containing sensor protein